MNDVVAVYHCAAYVNARHGPRVNVVSTPVVVALENVEPAPALYPTPPEDCEWFVVPVLVHLSSKLVQWACVIADHRQRIVYTIAPKRWAALRSDTQWPTKHVSIPRRWSLFWVMWYMRHPRRAPVSPSAAVRAKVLRLGRWYGANSWYAVEDNGDVVYRINVSEKAVPSMNFLNMFDGEDVAFFTGSSCGGMVLVQRDLHGRLRPSRQLRLLAHTIACYINARYKSGGLACGGLLTYNPSTGVASVPSAAVPADAAVVVALLSVMDKHWDHCVCVVVDKRNATVYLLDSDVKTRHPVAAARAAAGMVCPSLSSHAWHVRVHSLGVQRDMDCVIWSVWLALQATRSWPSPVPVPVVTTRKVTREVRRRMQASVDELYTKLDAQWRAERFPSGAVVIALGASVLPCHETLPLFAPHSIMEGTRFIGTVMRVE
jgi:hypothetical protein